MIQRSSRLSGTATKMRRLGKGLAVTLKQRRAYGWKRWVNPAGKMVMGFSFGKWNAGQWLGSTVFKGLIVQHLDLERKKPSLKIPTGNPRIPVDTLRIEGTSSIPIATATVGYFDGVTLATSGMFMKLGNSFDVADIVHELGHVLGMEHAHTRQDRDDYVQFRCEKLVEYYEKLGQYMMKKKPEDGPNGLCEDWNIAAWLGFSAADYVKGALPAGEQVPGQSPRTYRLWPVRSSGPYPVESVMQYPSDGAASGLCTKKNLKECPLVSVLLGSQSTTDYWPNL
jgi:hypothetical protein